MPRLARLDTSGLIHHVNIRGIERRKIFRDNKDREDMIDRRYELKSLGYDLDKLEKMVLEIYPIEREDLQSYRARIGMRKADK